jgi:hypothetical protein
MKDLVNMLVEQGGDKGHETINESSQVVLQQGY